MDTATYQETIRQFINYHVELGPFTLVLALGKHYGDFADKLFNILENKNGDITDEDKLKLAISLGDMINDITNMTSDIGFSLDDILQINLKKLELSNEMKTNNPNNFK